MVFWKLARDVGASQSDNRVGGMELMRINEIASFTDGRLAVSAGNLVKELGETLKKERGVSASWQTAIAWHCLFYAQSHFMFQSGAASSSVKGRRVGEGREGIS
jgi:hypothetical protein